jgi:hypothetical protein
MIDTIDYGLVEAVYIGYVTKRGQKHYSIAWDDTGDSVLVLFRDTDLLGMTNFMAQFGEKSSFMRIDNQNQLEIILINININSVVKKLTFDGITGEKCEIMTIDSYLDNSNIGNMK